MFMLLAETHAHVEWMLHLQAVELGAPVEVGLDVPEEVEGQLARLCAASHLVTTTQLLHEAHLPRTRCALSAFSLQDTQ